MFMYMLIIILKSVLFLLFYIILKVLFLFFEYGVLDIYENSG